jgi:hypothetical protein
LKESKKLTAVFDGGFKKLPGSQLSFDFLLLKTRLAHWILLEERPRTIPQR